MHAIRIIGQAVPSDLTRVGYVKEYFNYQVIHKLSLLV